MHGDKYDYSKVEYINSHERVCIICPKHGEFSQSATNHLSGQGCYKCGNDACKNLVFGVGVNDLRGCSRDKSYIHWHSMIGRCYNPKVHISHPRYKECKICSEWHIYSNFKRWFDDNYVDNWALDKDILVRGNKIYSPENCCFVPVEINNMFKDGYKQYLPRCVRKENGKYAFRCITPSGRTTKRGFSTPEDAYVAYRRMKKDYIKYLANKYKGQLNAVVYNALINIE